MTARYHHAHHPRRTTQRLCPLHALLSFVLLVALLPAAPIGARSSIDAAAPASLQSCGPSIAAGDTMACALVAAAEVDSMSFAGIGGDVLLVRVGITAGTMTPLVRVVGPNGVKLCEAGNTYAGGAEITRCALVQSGTHTITIADAVGTRTGSYNVYVQRLNGPAGATSLAIGATTVASISTAAESNSFTLAANAGDVVLLRAGVIAGTLTPLVRVFAPDGTSLCSAGTTYSAGAEITRCALPQAGSYSVLVGDAIGTRNGTYNLYLQRMNGPVGASALSAGETRPASLPSAAAADTYTVAASAGDVLLLRAGATAGTITPLVRVFDAGGVVLCSAGTSYSAGAEISRCALPQDGSYIVLVGDALATRTGNYNLYLQRVTAPSGASALVTELTTGGTIQAAAAMQTYTLEGWANEVVLLRAGVNAGTLTPLIAVYDPGGVRICEAGTSYSAGAEITHCQLPRSGRYVVLIGDALATRTGSYNLYAQHLTLPMTTFPLASGDSLAESIDATADADGYTWVAGDHDTIQVRVAATSGGLHPLVRVFDPAGVLVCQAGASYSVSADTGPCLLPRSGAFTILSADATAIQTGAYRIRLTCLTTPCGTASATRIDTAGGTIALDQLGVDVPANAVTEPLSLTLALLPGALAPIVEGDQTVRVFLVGAHTVDGRIVTQAQLPLQYSLHYSTGDLAGRTPSEARLRMVQWDAQAHQWLERSGYIDAGNRAVVAQSAGLRNVALVGAAITERQVLIPLVQR